MPSVSPLVKKYQSGHLKQRLDSSEDKNSRTAFTPSFQWDEKWDLCFEECLGECEDLDLFDSELEEMVTRIVI